MRNEKGQFVKGNTSWLKGTKGLITNSLKGSKMPEEWKAKLRKPKSVSHSLSQERKDKLSALRKLEVGELNHNWKGGDFVAHSAIRRQRIAKNGGFHTKQEWETLKAQYNWSCPCCLKQEPQIKLTQDHIVSIKKGGSDNIENIQPLCNRCNVKKHTKVIKYEYIYE